MRNDVFNEKSIGKVFAKFAIPSILGLLMVSMQIMIDGIYIGRYIGSDGLAAINLAMPYLNIVMSIVMMIVMGGGVITSIYLGEGNTKKASEVTTYTLLVKVVTLVVIALITMVFMDDLIVFLGAKGTLVEGVKDYLYPLVILSFFFNLIIYTETFLRISGKPSAVFFSGLIAVISNVILDYIFIVNLDLGLTGASVASILANGIGGIVLLPLVFRRDSKISLCKPKGDFKLLKTMLYNGSSEMLTIVSAAVATLIFNKILMEYIGKLGVSALTIVFYVNNIVNITLFGLSQGMQPIISYNLGAKNRKNIRDILRIALYTGGIIGVIAFIFMKINVAKVVVLFTKGDMELTNLAVRATSLFVFAYVISFINIIAASFHTAIEKPIESAVIAMVRSLILVVLFLNILPKYYGEFGIWVSVPLAEFLCAFLSVYLMIRSYKSIKRRLI